MENKNRFKRYFSREFIYWWIISLASVLLFDILWMAQTTFRPFCFVPFWPILLLNATILAVPSLFSRNGLINTALLLLFDLLFIANLMYCNTYFNAIPFHSYFHAGNLADFSSSVADSFRWYYIFLPVLTLLAYGVYIFWFRGKKRLQPVVPYLLLTFSLCVLSWCADAWRGGALANIEQMRLSANHVACIAPVYSIPGFLAYDYYKSTAKITPEEKRDVDQWLEDQRKYSLDLAPDSVRKSRKRPSNLVVVLCESLESWPIGREVEGKELTPVLNRLISDSTTFYAPNVLTQVGTGRSIDAQLLIFAGMLPMRNNIYAYDAVDNLFHTLPKAMKEEGARTYLLTCDKPYVWNLSPVTTAFGIDSLLTTEKFADSKTTDVKNRLSDGDLMARSAEKMKNGEVWPEGEKAFVAFVTHTGHHPFKVPEQLKRIDFEGNYPEILKDYMVAANYTDAAIGTLVDYLRSRSDWEDTMVVITGDHEGFATFRDEVLADKAGAEIIDPGQHTPLIILNSPIAGRYSGVMGQIDIYPTLLDLMQLDNYPWKGMGSSLFSPSFPGVAIGNRGDAEGDYKTLDEKRLRHLEKARDVSDLILKFDLLNQSKEDQQ